MSTPFKIITNQGQVFPLSDMIYTFVETGYVPKYAKDCLEDVNWVNSQHSLNFSIDNRTLKVFPLITDWSTYTDDPLGFGGQTTCIFDDNQTFTLKNGIRSNGFRDVHSITDLVFIDQNTPTDPVDLECVFYNMPQLDIISGFYTADNKEFKAITIGKANNLFDYDTNLTGQENFEMSFDSTYGLVEANSMMEGNTHATGLPTLTGTANIKRWDNSFNGYGYDVATTDTVGSYGNLEITLVNRSQIQDPDEDVANVYKMIHCALMIGSLTINGSGGPDPDNNSRWCPVYWEELDLDNELVVAWLNQLKIYVDSTLLSEYISRNKERCGGDSTKEAYVDAIFSAIS